MAIGECWTGLPSNVTEVPWVPIERVRPYGRPEPTEHGGRLRQLTRRIFGRQSEPPVHQVITLCGKRVHETPGRGDVTCAECLSKAVE
jgi:hypothetical protein